MKVLVTGGAGFIGSNLVRKLSDLGHDPVVLDDISSGYRVNILPNLPFYEGDVRDANMVIRASEDCELIFHLAASVGNARSIKDPIKDAQINVLGTLNVLEAARKNAIERVVFSSSAGIFGELKTLPIAEDHPQDPDSPYGISKLAAEKLCLVYNKLYSMKNICLRYFNVFGPYQRFDAYGNVIPIFSTRLLKQETITIFGDGEQTRDFVNVRDVVNANILAATTDGAKGVFNIGSGTRISINLLVDLLQDVSGRLTKINYGPPRIGDVRDSLADITLAKKTFSYQPETDIRFGLKEYWTWLLQDQLSNSGR